VIAAAQGQPEFLERLAKLGVEPVTPSSEDFAQTITADIERWREIIRDMGLK